MADVKLVNQKSKDVDDKSAVRMAVDVQNKPPLCPQIQTQSGPSMAIQIMQGPNGQLQVAGLLPGQQLVQLPDGRLQLRLVTTTPTIGQPSVQGQPINPMPSSTPVGNPNQVGNKIVPIQPKILPKTTPTPTPTPVVPSIICTVPTTSQQQLMVSVPNTQTRMCLRPRTAPTQTASGVKTLPPGATTTLNNPPQDVQKKLEALKQLQQQKMKEVEELAKMITACENLQSEALINQQNGDLHRLVNSKHQRKPQIIRESDLLKEGKTIKSQARQLVLNVRKRLQLKHPQLGDSALDNMAANATGLTEQTVCRLRTNYEPPSSKGKTGISRETRRVRLIEIYDESLQSIIRQRVHKFYAEKQQPTLPQLVTVLKTDSKLPSFSENTLHRLLCKIGFECVKDKLGNTCVTECVDAVACRRQYLRAIRAYRSQGRQIYYMAETWVNVGECEEQSTSALKMAKRKKLIVGHVGSNAGFVENGLIVFAAKKTSGEYHTKMNARHFIKWVKSVFPHMEPRSVIVLESAPHHCVVKDPLPDSTWLNGDIRKWCVANDVYFEKDYVKAELLQAVDVFRTNWKVTYQFDELAKEFGFRVLRLPPYHCLSLMDKALKQVKNYVRCHNTTYKIEDVQKLVKQGVDSVTDKQWDNYVLEVENEEETLWWLDGMNELQTCEPGMAADDASNPMRYHFIGNTIRHWKSLAPLK